MMFRYNKKLPIPYDRQGYIYFYAKNFKRMPQEERAALEQVCRKAGHEDYKALLAYVTGSADAVAVCREHYLDERRLFRILRAFYLEMDRLLG